MINLPSEYNLPLIWFGIFLLGWIIQLYYLFIYFLKGTKPPQQLTKDKPGVSVIICARNEERNLMEHIPVIMEQDYPNFELVVVNDSSWDDTEAILKAMQVRYKNIHVVNLDEEKQNMQGKKFALTLGIKAAKYDYVLLTDADCTPLSDQWIASMMAHVNDTKNIVLGVSLFHRQKGWLNKIVRFDSLMTATQYVGFAQNGKPYMGVGRNLAYHRDMFFKVGGFKSHYSIASGDDDLFINQVATNKNTSVAISQHEQTVSAPKETWQSWYTQKRRHFTTAPYYKLQHKRMLALWPVSLALMWLGFMGSIVFHKLLLIVGGLLLVRYISQVAILHKISKRMSQSRDIAWLAPVLEIHLTVLNFGLYFSNLLRKPQKWS
jgi:cellulose synthase/poly-beta-1,6-N-acetylglucosamine synthase-like glycosyltransferase